MSVGREGVKSVVQLDSRKSVARGGRWSGWNATAHNGLISPVFVLLDNVPLTRQKEEVSRSSAAAVEEQNSTMNGCRSVRRVQW